MSSCFEDLFFLFFSFNFKYAQVPINLFFMGMLGTSKVQHYILNIHCVRKETGDSFMNVVYSYGYMLLKVTQRCKTLITTPVWKKVYFHSKS